jgi:hypothetical protein
MHAYWIISAHVSLVAVLLPAVAHLLAHCSSNGNDRPPHVTQLAPHVQDWLRETGNKDFAPG